MAGEPITPETKDGPPAWLVEKRENAIRDCRMFYSDKDKPPTESLMCFSWECGSGWNDALAKMSYKIEALNLALYGKYRVKCVAEQIKEKFGTLRAYTRVTVDPPAWKSFLPNMLMRLHNRVSNMKVDYAMKKVVDSPRHVEYEYEQMVKADFEKAGKDKYKCSNVDYHEDSGRFYKVTRLDRYERYHYSPTKNVLLYRLNKAVRTFALKLECWAGSREPSPEQMVMSEFMDSAVEKIIRDAERECYYKCEKCGTDIGTDYSPRCETKGWVTYLCEKCAKKQGGNYVKHSSKTEERKDEDQD